MTAEGEGAGRKGEGEKRALFSPPSFSARPSFPPAPRSVPGYPRMRGWVSKRFPMRPKVFTVIIIITMINE